MKRCLLCGSTNVRIDEKYYVEMYDIERIGPHMVVWHLKCEDCGYAEDEML